MGESGEWLMQLFKEKDEIKAAYLADDWDKLSSLGQFTARYPPKRVWHLLWTDGANILVLTPLSIILLQGGVVTWSLALVVLGLAWALLEQLISVSKIKKDK